MMQRTPPLALLTLALVSLSVAGFAIADDDDRNERKRGYVSNEWIDDDVPLAPIRSQGYLEECGACHMAYQPELLPARASTNTLAVIKGSVLETTMAKSANNMVWLRGLVSTG